MIVRSRIAWVYLVCLVPAAAHAQLLAYDPFNQSNGTLNGTASSGGGAVWPTNPQLWQAAYPPSNGGSVTANSLTYGSLATSGGKVAMPGFSGSNNGSYRALGTDRGGGPADLWISFLHAGDSPGGYVLQLANGNNLVADFGSPGGPAYGMRLYNEATGAGTGTQTTVAATPTITPSFATHFFAVHLQLGQAGNTNTVTMYLDPDTGSLGTAAPAGGSVAVYSTALNFHFDGIALAALTPASGPAYFDEIRIGTTWTAVTPVPEPVGLTAVAVGGVGFVRAGQRWRRRERQRLASPTRRPDRRPSIP